MIQTVGCIVCVSFSLDAIFELLQIISFIFFNIQPEHPTGSLFHCDNGSIIEIYKFKILNSTYFLTIIILFCFNDW